MNKTEILVESCRLNKIEIDEFCAKVLMDFCSFLLYKNEQFNLTRIVELNDFVVKHLVDSLFVEKLVNFDFGSSFLDVGSGAGFPSVPIAIKRPDLKVVQIDCLGKRVRFLEEVAQKFGLNCKAYHGRAEDFGKQQNFREKFRFVVARAVAPMNRLVEYCLPFVEVGGFFVAMKGKNFVDELGYAENALKELGGKIFEIKKFEILCDGGEKLERAIVLVNKISQTPTKYPRINSKILKCAL